MMLTRKIVTIVLPFFVVPFFVAGCSGKSWSITDVGNRILQFSGILPPKQVFEAGEGLLKATETMTREEEYYLGRAVAAHILAQYPPYEQQEREHYLLKVTRALSAHSSLPETFGGYHIGILDVSEPQAFSAPGGKILLSRGVFDILPDEDALAAVLAHEVAHIALRHGVRSISQENVNQTVLALGQLAGTLNCAQVIQQATGVFGVAAEDVVDTLLERGYSRAQEEEADRAAIAMLHSAGYDPQALEEAVMLISGQDEEGWFRSHPGGEQRLEQIRHLLEGIRFVPTPQAKLARSGRYRRIFR